MHRHHFKFNKMLALASVGGALEFFDFAIYALFARYISNAFFPQQNHFVALLNTFAVFALGYFARPLGGIIFGHLGDKHGRKIGFTTSALLMATATLLLGCCPTYHQIGIAAPVLLVILRILQGISVGGEIPGATVFVFEHSSPRNLGFAIGAIFMAITLGNVLGSLLGYILTHHLSVIQMQQWGWRIPFAAGFLLGINAYLMRRKMAETPHFFALWQKSLIERSPLKKLFAIASPQIFMGIAMTALSAATIFLFLYLPSYLGLEQRFSMNVLYAINTLSFTVLAFGSALFGYCSNFVARLSLIRVGIILALIISYFLFKHLHTLSLSSYLIFCVGLAITVAMVNGCYPIVIAELFRSEIRYSGMAVAYNLGFAIFGGLAPLVMTWLSHTIEKLSAPYWFLFLGAIITLAATFLIQKKENRVVFSPN